MQVIDNSPMGSLEPEQTAMFAEAAESADVVEHQLEHNQSIIADIVTDLIRHEPRAVITCARGSSDHAATFLKYLIESQLGVLTSSASPSVQSIYRSPQQLADTLYVTVTQSGKSPDLLDNAKRAKDAGAKVLVLVNDEQSPIVSLADFVIPLRAGNETSVAATKSFIATISAMLHLVAQWSADPRLKEGLSVVPDGLRRAWDMEWQPAIDMLVAANNLFVIGRGLGLGIAQEAALKLKEVCGLHAEAFSSAEVRHGPMALVGDGFPVLVLAQRDETLPGIDQLVADFRGMGAKVLLAAADYSGKDALAVTSGYHWATEPLMLIQSFYRMSNELAIRRGFNPDQPPHLRKVTETV